MNTRLRDLFLALALFVAALVWAPMHPYVSLAPAQTMPPSEPIEVAPLTRSWEQAIPNQSVPDGLETLQASECGSCHEEIYTQWRTSTHAHALSDLQFQAEWAKDDYLWLCVNCHTPLQNQIPEIVLGTLGGDHRLPVTEPNPFFDAELREEAITCATCHVRDGAVIGLSSDIDAPHATRQTQPTFFNELCLSCHNVQEQLSDTLVCSFTTGDEWSESPTGSEEGACYRCHMPQQGGPTEGDVPVLSHDHSLIGAGIAKDLSEMEDMRAAYRPGYDVELEAVRSAALAGEDATLRIRVVIANTRAGHHLPTGDPERFITLDLAVIDDAGSEVWTRQERIGEIWEWEPRARAVFDNSLAPGERRELAFDVSVAGAESELRVDLIVRNHRMTEENAAFHELLGRYPLSIETFRQSVWIDRDVP